MGWSSVLPMFADRKARSRCAAQLARKGTPGDDRIKRKKKRSANWPNV